MIKETIQAIHEQLPPQTRLVAVSKYHPAEAIMEAYEAGQRIFGESHVQELQRKALELPQDIEWHFIGHLQTNKVKYIAPYVSLIHAVDSERLLAEIDKQGKRIGRSIPCLLQLHIAREETKFGFSEEELISMLENGTHLAYTSVNLCGLMCMASNVDDEEQIADEFARAHSLFLTIKDRYFKDNTDFAQCSWGMSDDYPLAIAHGSTLVRIGSKIFGSRQ
ncbi:MAG: YggS family pyridoxal phosphate-dependent enzyme [Bacteroidaceae bacterium]|nr:YggS family pyridoxal phosphate-dependent enzyme [Bacteroidaceae bacterium]